MLAKEFLNKYNTLSIEDQINFISGNIKTTYMPIGEKIDFCNKIVKSTSYKLNKQTAKLQLFTNSPAKYLLYTMQVIDYYTYIDIDFSNITGQYDMLNEVRVISEFYNAIPKCELDELDMVMEMCTSDLIHNEYEPRAFIVNRLSEITEQLSDSLVPAIEVLTDTISTLDDAKVKKLVKALDSSKLIKLLKR